MNEPFLQPIYAGSYSFDGAIGSLLQSVTAEWLLVAPKANPAMLEMFSTRDSRPYRSLLPWSGEFAGKYLTSAVQVFRLTRDPHLKAWLTKFVERLVSLQDSDGYLGPWPEDCRLTNYSPYHGSEDTNGNPKYGKIKGLQTWDTWGHYHIMTGLILWYEESGDGKSLEAACKAADLLCRKYLGEKKTRLVDTGSTEMNLAPVHALARLYRCTSIQRYLEMALQIVDEFSAQSSNGPLAGDYLNQALARKDFYQMPKPRWESLHPIMGLAELYWITGENRFRTAFERIWWSIVENDRHNNGGFSSGEQATGNPYDPAPIETCCTIAWIALSVEMLKMTGNPVVADELELSMLNSILGMHSPSGRWATYNTPSDGARFASAHHIVFQSRSGSPELNCCSVNSPRGLGLLSEWAVMQGQDGIYLNYYGPTHLRLSIGNGADLAIRQETDYPVSGKITLYIEPSSPVWIALRLRIPAWSQATHLSLNGLELSGVEPGHYYEVSREWQQGDKLELVLDMSLHIWRGERQSKGKASIYRGPILLAYDQRYNPETGIRQMGRAIPEDLRLVNGDYLNVPRIDLRQISVERITWDGWFPPILLLKTTTPKGQTVWLCDFASAGATGTLYRSWIPVTHAPRTQAFSRLHPLPTTRG